MVADPERELVERCRADDADALRELLNRYASVVFLHVAGVTADPARTEQLALDVFLRIHRDLPYFRGETSLETWVLRTAVNVCAIVSAGRDVPDHAIGVSEATGKQPVPPQFV